MSSFRLNRFFIVVDRLTQEENLKTEYKRSFYRSNTVHSSPWISELIVISMRQLKKCGKLKRSIV